MARRVHRGRNDFYPRPPRGGRRPGLKKSPHRGGISIHALREEGDRTESPCVAFCIFNFYPRPPRGGRLVQHPIQRIGALFLSTPSARRATSCQFWDCQRGLISIHALREEGDHAHLVRRLPGRPFLSTPSARRATVATDHIFIKFLIISIHALREEGDLTSFAITSILCVISIHALREEGD